MLQYVTSHVPLSIYMFRNTAAYVASIAVGLVQEANLLACQKAAHEGYRLLKEGWKNCLVLV